MKLLVHPNTTEIDTWFKHWMQENPGQQLSDPSTDQRRCCGLARTTFCVCLIRHVCPVHGDRCHGTHD